MKKRTMKPRPAGSALVPRVIKRRFPHVTRVVDATKPIHVSVTDADSDDAVSSDFEHCALARAACRQLKADGAVVSKRVVYVIIKDAAVRYDSSERIRQELVSFDRHHDFASGDYALNVKRPSERLGAPSRHYYTRDDPRARHDRPGQRWVPAPRVRDLNMADAADKRPTKRKR
jgi:hypothetical protein